ncbi:MAG TPA: hypothetical protein VFC53_02695 [Dehalococcoidia bacterium]|nr:hypothetical protein [Dehalococcoidia bacterium]
MPETKGRRRKRERERRRRAEGEARPGAPSRVAGVDAPRRRSGAGNMPSATARMTGLMVGIVTAFLAILMIVQQLQDGVSGADAALRIVAGVLMVGVAVVLGALVLAPGAVARAIRRVRR